jgi:nucleotide-binding universal stress UspA family protein
VTYRTILAELNSSVSVEGRLQVCRSLATRFDATIIGMHVTPSPLEAPIWKGGTGAYLPPAMVEARRAAAREQKERIRAAFDSVGGRGPSMIWREAEGDPVQLLSRAARACDLVVTERGEELDTAGLVTAAGVPVLVLPPHGPHDLGRTVLVGWNGRRESTRAAHDALPFLLGGERVVLCAVGDGAAETLDDAAAMLKRHGAPVQAERLEGADAHAGEILLAQAIAYRADLLVMGAYGHSRLREFVFGGATHHMLQRATLPVLFSG